MRKLQVTPNLRVSQAETRLTVYRLLDIRKLFELVSQIGGSATIGIFGKTFVENKLFKIYMPLSILKI